MSGFGMSSAFNLGHINARSILNQFDILRDHVSANDFDIVGISETWLRDNIVDNLININNYNFVRRDRAGRGGGVGVFLRASYTYTVLESPFNEFIEQLWLRVRIASKVVGIGVVYRPPHVNCYNFFEMFENTLTSVILEVDEVFCVGDFNINLLDNNSTLTTDFLLLVDSYGLSQLIDEPTRITDNSATLLDLILSTAPSLVISTTVLDLHNYSDHAFVSALINCGSSKVVPVTRTFRSFTGFQYDSFYQDLINAPFGIVFDCDDVDYKVNAFVSLLHVIFDYHIPVVTRTFTRKHKPWITETIRLMQYNRDKALQKFKLTRNNGHWQYYKTLRNLTTSAIRNEKKAYINFRIKNANPNSMWKELRVLDICNFPKSGQLPDTLSDANLINKFFTESSATSNSINVSVLDFYKYNVMPSVASTFHFEPTCEGEILQVINSITSRSAGIDNIDIKLIKLCCPTIIPVLCHIYNVCIAGNVFPSTWKIARVIPLPKLRNPQQVSDLRPISILPVLSKIFEKILEKQIRVHLNNFNILPQFQSGFRPHHSCTTAMVNVVDDVLRASDAGKVTCLVLLDYSKAFDTLNHKLLHAILHYIGFGNNASALIYNYLIGRRQMVVLSGSTSQLLDIDAGVPQGSVLGPLLFTIYTCNLHSVLHYTSYHCYADDTQLYYSFDPSEADSANFRINRDVTDLLEYSSAHNLTVNPKKSRLIFFGKSRVLEEVKPLISITINNLDVEVVDVVRDLGLLVSSDLRFKEHIASCSRKAYTNLKLLYNSYHILGKSTKILLCNSLVLSHLNYCDVAYGPCLDRLTSVRIQRIQNSCIRYICGLRRRDHVSHKLNELCWLNMENRRKLHLYCFAYKVLTFRTPPYLSDKITFRSDVHNINIRHPHFITPPLHGTTLFERSFSYNIANLMNSLKFDYRATTFSSYRKAIFELLYASQM